MDLEVAMNHDTRRNKIETSSDSEVDTDVEDIGLTSRKPKHQFSGATVPGPTKTDNSAGEPSDNNAYLNKYGGAIEDLNIEKVLNSMNQDGNNKGEIILDIATNREVILPKREQREEEITEEEVIELEFEKAIPKLHTHTMHCPNCKNEITKVILRRKIIKPRVIERLDEPKELVGCFSCFSLFTKDNGCFNPFPIFWNTRADGNGVIKDDGNCFSIFQIWRKEKDPQTPKPDKTDQDSKPSKQGKIDQDPKPSKPEHIDREYPIPKGDNSHPDANEGQPKRDYKPPVPGVGPSHYDQVEPYGQDESRVDIPPVVSPAPPVLPQRPAGQDSTSFEILKSIVYGGLMEVIASLSIVASAAAGDATTLSIIALALANLVGGVFVIGHNLWDLRDDCYKTSNDQEAHNKYKEVLGSVEHFPLHAFFAILSFLVFGIIPPMAYGYAFHETNDKDFTMLVVAIASLVCVGLLAIFKAYVDRCIGFAGYVKIITYYLTTAVAVSGVSYAVGNLAERLIEEFGWFETSSNVAMTALPEVVSMNPSLAYY